jgi:hypothetical protein
MDSSWDLPMAWAKHFLNEYAVKFGVPLPGRLPNHRNLKVTLLPSDKTIWIPAGICQWHGQIKMFFYISGDH